MLNHGGLKTVCRIVFGIRGLYLLGMLAVLTGCADPKPPVPPLQPPSQVPATPVAKPVTVSPDTEVKKPDGVSLYFPHTPGDCWDMEMRGEGSVEKIKLLVLKDPRSSDNSRFILETSRDGKLVQRDTYSVDEHGIAFVGSGIDTETVIEPAMPILRLPVSSGDHWDWTGKFKSGKTEYQAVASFAVAGPDSVTTAAGVFQAFRVDQHLTVKTPGQDIATNTTLWFAPKVGLVKQVIDSPTQKGEALLIGHGLTTSGQAEDKSPKPQPLKQ
jgi:hypothetical protein